MNRTKSIWTRLDFFIHRWIGAVLGGLVFVWFASGIVLMYYPYPSIPATRQLGMLQPFVPDSTLLGFGRASQAATRSLEANGATVALVSGRLELLGDRLVYRFLRDSREGLVPAALVDAHSGVVLSPVGPGLALAAARRIAGKETVVAGIELERQADHYMLDVAYGPQFPAWRVRFDDPRATAVYVSTMGANPFGIVTRLTRVTTWTGTVPHWFYFIWLYSRPTAWSLAFVIAASLVILLACTGIVWGILRLFPLRSRGDNRLTLYRGVSKWHHLAGLVFGVLVLSWTASGLYQNFGEDSSPRAGQAARIRGGPTRWDAINLTEAAVLTRLNQPAAAVLVQAIDLVQFDGRPGYVVHFADGHGAWVDAGDGAARRELDEPDRRRAAELAVDGSAPVDRFDRLTSYDRYYYVRHGRELPLPVWRATFRDRDATLLYFDPLTGAPAGFVNRASKRARWLRDAVHSLDFGLLNNHRPLWDLVMLPLLLGGLTCAGSGLIMMPRMLRAAARRAKQRRGG